MAVMEWELPAADDDVRSFLSLLDHFERHDPTVFAASVLERALREYRGVLDLWWVVGVELEDLGQQFAEVLRLAGRALL
jgi:hypothetical protein